MVLTQCGRYLVSMDTLNKVMVANFPMMPVLKSVNVDRKSDLKDFAIFNGKIATIGQEANDQAFLLVSDLLTGETLSEYKLAKG